VLLLAGAAAGRASDDAPALPPAQVSLRVDAPDPVGPWKMVVTNQGDVPVRFAADGRLLTFEMPKPEDPYEPAAKKKRKTPPPVVCRLPPELRPAGVIEDRAIVLPPGARYEEVVSPALYCFSEASAKALVPGATITAKIGFAPRAKTGKKNVPEVAPFVAEPAVTNPTVSALKEIVSEPFVLPAAGPTSPPNTQAAANKEDPNGPRLELRVPARVDTPNELTVGMTLTIKNVGARPTSIHLRRDNLVFDVDGPSGPAHCGLPAERRNVPKEGFSPLAPGASRTLDVWVGEMCADVVFDRPGLYRIWPSLAFPNAGSPSTIKVWTETITSKEPVLVRVREGRLPFYTSPPQVFGAPR
jgi:hypothetical protein